MGWGGRFCDSRDDFGMFKMCSLSRLSPSRCPMLPELHTYLLMLEQKWLPKAADDVKILLCGPPPMISAMKKATESLGYKKARPVSKLDDQVFAF